MDYNYQKSYWNKMADSKSFTTPFQFSVFSKYISKDDMILDIGCGYGRTLHQLYEKGYNKLYGIDFSKNMIDRGKLQFSHLNLECTDSKSLEYEDNSFDAVIILAVLTSIISNDDQLALISEIRRVLKPKGIIYINDFLINSDERNVKRYNVFHNMFNKYGVFELPEGAIMRHHTVEWIKELVSCFDEIEFEEMSYTTMNGNTSRGFYYLGRKEV
ncbi:hypothetical protein AN1V17_46230 [Vallitalea sediminicola]